MAQDLTVNINAKSNVPEAMDKAKSATMSFSKQVEDIQKKFGMAFKDVFLSFLGPLALLGIAMNYIGKLIDENRKKQEDANKAAIDDTNALMSAEDKYYAKKRNNEKKAKETTEEAKTQREETTLQFLLNDPRGKNIYGRENIKYLQGFRTDGITALPYYKAKQRKDIQDEVQALIAEDIKTNPMAGAAAGKETNFKGPEGFSNVVGVGANPVLEAINEQIEIQKQQLAALQEIANKGTSPTDFTKESK
jgi:hypothetical protein